MGSRCVNLNNVAWTSVVIHPFLLRVVGRMTSEVFVGSEISQDPTWRHTCIEFATCIFGASGILKALPTMLRPVARWFLPHIWRIRSQHARAKKTLLPELDHPWTAAKPQRSILDWFKANSTAEPEIIIKRQLGLGFASIHTTTNHLTNVLLDLAARWNQYAPELITEIEKAMHDDQGIMKKSTIAKLSKLDSFMKESQRMNPPSACESCLKLITQ